MPRSALLTVPLAVAALAMPTWAVAQQAQGTTTTSGTSSTTTGSTTPTTSTPAYTGPPRISTLRLRKTVNAEQGHARFLVGFTSKGPLTTTITITSLKDKKVVRTITGPQDDKGGPVWFLVQAVNDQGYQLPVGSYSIVVTGTDSQGRKAKGLKQTFRLNLTPPRGRIDGYTVPNLPAIARQAKIAEGGQLLTAVVPKGVLVTAGLRRGDVVTKLNNVDVTTPGQWAAALKALPADTPVPIEYRRGTEVRTGTISAPPDWNPAPDLSKVFVAAAKKDKAQKKQQSLGVLLGSVRERIDAGKADEAQKLLDAWPKARKDTSIGQMVQGEILLAKNDLKGALAAYEAATQKDPNLAPALLGQGLVLSRLDRTTEAVPMFQAAVTADPGNAIAQAFLAYALTAAKQYDAAIAAATQAATLDPKYEDGPVALGLALIASGQKAQGVAQLKKGLLLMSDQKRADQLIAESLEPNA